MASAKMVQSNEKDGGDEMKMKDACGRSWEEMIINAGHMEYDDVVFLGEDEFRVHMVQVTIPFDDIPHPLERGWIDVDLRHIRTNMIWSIKVPLDRTFKVCRCLE